MSASKLNPNRFHGEERDGGFMGRNTKMTSANSPHWRGRVYLIGVGWYWLSGWDRDGDYGPLISLRAQEMTDEQAAKFCAPKMRNTGKHVAPKQQRGSESQHQNGTNGSDTDIPF